MYEGEFVDVVDPDEVTEEELGLLMAGREREETVATDDADRHGTNETDDGRPDRGVQS
jgi:simple sugar transport system ATP-binding protein